MTNRQQIKFTLLSSLIILSLGGWLLHLRAHPPSSVSYGLIPFFSGILSVIIIPFLFSRKSLIHYGYVLNGMLVILGTITMAHFSIEHRPDVFSFKLLFLRTLLPDILMLWAKFAAGKALFDFERAGNNLDGQQTGRMWRYPNMGWWTLHLFTLSLIYFLGHIFWR
jgi:hypothetical protein